MARLGVGSMLEPPPSLIPPFPRNIVKGRILITLKDLVNLGVESCLSPAQRRAIELQSEGKGRREIAREMSIGVNHAKNLLQQVRRRAAERLPHDVAQRYGMFRTATPRASVRPVDAEPHQ